MAIVRQTEQLRGRLASLVERLDAEGALPGGWALAEHDVEQGIALVFSRGGRSLRVELDQRDESRGCYAATARFNVYYALQERGSNELGPSGEALMSAVIEVVRKVEGSLPVTQVTEGDPSRALIREVEVERVLVRDGERGYYINPYVGCLIACPYCYAIHRADFSRSLDGAPIVPWGRWLDVKVNAPEVLAEEVKSRPRGPVRLSPIVTDPYQPVEKTYRITERCLEILVDAGFSPIVLTRSSQVERDLPILARAPGGAIGMSVPTDDDTIRAAFEPNAEPIAERVLTIERAKAAGVRTFAVIQPLLPMDPDRLVELLAPHVIAVRLGPMTERQRSKAIYESVGRLDALDPAWERNTAEHLTRAFGEAGVLVDPDGPEWGFLRT